MSPPKRSARVDRALIALLCLAAAACGAPRSRASAGGGPGVAAGSAGGDQGAGGEGAADAPADDGGGTDEEPPNEGGDEGASDFETDEGGDEGADEEPPNEGGDEGDPGSENGDEGVSDCVPQREVCDGRDNDCDDEVDEDDPDLGDACDTGMMGPCWQGRQRCMEGGLECVGVVAPMEEICDGVDNDCDGGFDEGRPESNQRCAAEVPGECGFGLTRCEDGFLWCDGLDPSPEVCDLLDNDCDGEVDEAEQLQEGDVPPEGAGHGEPCETGELGACADGVGVCDAGEYSCEQQVFPSDEVCDSVDNDCDGEEDEDDGQGTCGADCESIGFERLVQGEVVLCYSDQAGVCQDVHGACESLGDGYRLMCGDHWQPGKDGQGCGGNGSYTAYDFVNQHFPGSAAFGAYSQGRENCVRGGQNNSCNGDVGNQDDWNTNGNYGVCAPQNFFMAAQDGEAWANVCGS